MSAVSESTAAGVVLERRAPYPRAMKILYRRAGGKFGIAIFTAIGGHNGTDAPLRWRLQPGVTGHYYTLSDTAFQDDRNVMAAIAYVGFPGQYADEASARQSFGREFDHTGIPSVDD